MLFAPGRTLLSFIYLILTSGRWLDLKLKSPNNKMAGFVSVYSLLQIGIILMFYREPLY